MNISKECRQKHVNSGKTVCVCLLISYERSRAEAEHDNDLHVKDHKSMKPYRNKLLSAPQRSIELSLKSVVNTALQGLHPTPSDQAQILFHFLCTSCIVDIPECEDMPFVKGGTRPSAPFHIHLIKAVSFNINRTAEMRNLKESCSLSTEASKGFLLNRQTLAEYLRSSIPPVLHCFSIVDVHVSVDIYKIFRYAPMHGLAFELLKMFKKCLGIYLSDQSRTATAIKYR